MNVHADLKTISSTLKMPLLALPIKMTLVRLGDKTVLISPDPQIEKHAPEIDSFGKITDIIAPNLYHNLGVTAAHNLYPTAKLWGPEGLKSKLPELQGLHELSLATWPYSRDLPMFAIAGMPRINEVGFIHRASKSLIVTDLCFNHVHGKGLGNWIVFNIFGTYKRFAVSRLFLKMVKDKIEFSKSIRTLLNEDFENIIVPHGENVIGNGKSLLADAIAARKISA